MNESQAIKSLSALAQETRLKIVKYLVECGPEGAAAATIAKKVSASASRLSFHLTALEQSELITSQRISRSIVYRMNFDQMGILMSYLLQDCCKNHPAIRSCCGQPVGNG